MRDFFTRTIKTCEVEVARVKIEKNGDISKEIFTERFYGKEQDREKIKKFLSKKYQGEDIVIIDIKQKDQSYKIDLSVFIEHAEPYEKPEKKKD